MLLLKRNLLVILHFRRGRRGGGRLARRGVSAAAVRAALFIAAPIEHLHRAGDDFRAVLLLPRLLVVPAVGADRAVDVNELRLLQILPADLGELAPGDDVVPLGA